VGEQRQRHDQVGRHPRWKLPAPALRLLARHLDRIVNGVRRNPGRQHAQGNPVSQTPPSHHSSLSHGPRSCTREPPEGRYSRQSTTTKPKWHGVKGCPDSPPGQAGFAARARKKKAGSENPPASRLRPAADAAEFDAATASTLRLGSASKHS